MRKRIAVLAGQVDETTQTRLLKRFIKKAYEYDYDVCVFSLFQKYQETLLRNNGDSNIFELVNYNLFDAVFVMIDTILTPGLSIPLQESIREKFSGPVLILDQESDIFPWIMMDHYTPVKKIIDHLIEVHGYKKIAFLGGKEGHPHSVQRLNAFKDSMKAHGIDINEDWIYHGNYWYDSAENFVDILLKDRDNLPEVLACANDCMAIGAAERFTEHGIRVPEDIAVTGYDSFDAGKQSPKPLTSADIPADECGEYCMEWLHQALNGQEQPEFVADTPIFIGGSCGCDYEIEMVPKALRTVWRTQQSSRSMFSDFNHVLDNLLSSTNIREFMQVALEYSYQIRPYNKFYICLNDGFLNAGSFIGDNAIRKGYAPIMYEVLSCDGNEEITGSIDLERCFATSQLLPDLHEERDYPTTYIFNPLFFDDRCFGYAVINFGKEIRMYDQNYRISMRNIMQGMESLYRQGFMQDLVEKIKADQIRDSLTGLYNYEGFIKHLTTFLNKEDATKRQVNIISLDVKGMKQINEVYGRDSGERAIRIVARCIQNIVREDEVCCRMCNDEFLVALYDNATINRGQEIVDNIIADLKKYVVFQGSKDTIQIYYATMMGIPENISALEGLINRTISIKDHKKGISNKSSGTQNKDLMDEIKRNQLVTQILNRNLLTYYYQPIVNTIDGSIYAYEALMRYEAEKISPFHIIQSAIYLNRLSDIERMTLLNVTGDVQDNIEKFGDAKVFLNSLPGVSIGEDDDKVFSERLKNNRERFVIEFTEESELDDNQLKALKDKYKLLGSQIAVDDFGAGYSNVNNLLRYMPHYVKIDRMLISDIHNNPQKQHMVSSIIEFAHNNDFIALAEGVETSDEMRECIKLGADLIQGYYTGRPTREPVKEIDPEIRKEIERYRFRRMGWKIMKTLVN